MKIYLTSESRQRIRSSFSNLSLFQIIDVGEIVQSLRIDMGRQSSEFLINEEITQAIEFAMRSKKINGIIYINPNLTADIISNIRSVADSNGNVDSVVMIDDQDNPKMMDYYHCVDEILYFPILKRIKIIECQPLPIVFGRD